MKMEEKNVRIWTTELLKLCALLRAVCFRRRDLKKGISRYINLDTQ